MKPKDAQQNKGRGYHHETDMINVSSIDDDGTRLRRTVQEETVTRLMESMRTIGLKTPIVVQHFPERPSLRNDTDDSVILLVGGHRLEAAKRLGWDKIECVVLPDDADAHEIRLWEIAENLDRSELTQLERKEHIAEWMRLTESKTVSRQVAAKLSTRGRKEGRPESGVNAVARELGVNDTEARRAIKIDGLDEAAKQTARDLDLDNNQSALLKASREKTAGDQIASLQLQAELAARKKQHKSTDQLREEMATEEFAQWIMGNLELDGLPLVVEWLELVKPRNVIAALRRMTKDPPPIMDRRYAS